MLGILIATFPTWFVLELQAIVTDGLSLALILIVFYKYTLGANLLKYSSSLGLMVILDFLIIE